VLDVILHHSSISPICVGLLVLYMSCVCQLINKRIYDDDDDDDELYVCYTRCGRGTVRACHLALSNCSTEGQIDE